MRYLITCLLFACSVQSAAADSRCDQTRGLWWSTVIACEHNRVTIAVAADDYRDVLYQTPLGNPPEGGWPVVFIYQGSYIPVQFSGRSGQAWGGYHQIRLIRELLDNGFAVVAPEAVDQTFWDTNTARGRDYVSSGDHHYLTMLFDIVSAGGFGQLNAERMYATGISSGGYNTSRMAVSFPGRFRALAIQSGSYATCAGFICKVPDALPDDHPPTLFLHGSEDRIVPEWTMVRYADRLYQQGIPVYVVTDEVGHEWLESAPDDILNWFLANP